MSTGKTGAFGHRRRESKREKVILTELLDQESIAGRQAPATVARAGHEEAIERVAGPIHVEGCREQPGGRWAVELGRRLLQFRVDATISALQEAMAR